MNDALFTLSKAKATCGDALITLGASESLPLLSSLALLDDLCQNKIILKLQYLQKKISKKDSKKIWTYSY